ncbi:MAG: LysM peptidoglycan-binding domain-containing protein [Nibricoccus sp.]
MRSRLFTWLAFAIALLMVGCERSDTTMFTVETDEPGYRRAVDLKRQGRNAEALQEFLKVISKRGLDNAPESHLEVGMLYQLHLKDPIRAIYHYQKYRELRPTGRQADLVRQRIDSATRDFATMLPARPLDNQIERLDYSDQLQLLRRENEKLKLALAAARAGRPVPAPTPENPDEAPAIEETAAQNPPTPTARPTTAPVTAAELSPVQAAPETQPSPVQPAPLPTPVRPAVAQPTPRPSTPAVTSTQRPTSTPATQSTAGGRRHIVRPQENLYGIARKYYGTASNAKVEAIFNANRDKMRDKGDLRAGMELRIP